MKTLLVVLSIPAALAGLAFSSQATSGVAILAFAVWLIALARIVQADRQHFEVKSQLSEFSKYIGEHLVSMQSSDITMAKDIAASRADLAKLKQGYFLKNGIEER